MPTQTPEQEMTLAEAVAVLNERRHNGGTWVVSYVDGDEFVEALEWEGGTGCFSEFEAIAIAREYERLRARENA
jgi:hypothetical protein